MPVGAKGRSREVGVKQLRLLRGGSIMSRTSGRTGKSHGGVRSDDYDVGEEKHSGRTARGVSVQTFLDPVLAEEWRSLVARSKRPKLAFLRWLVAYAVEHDIRPNRED